jgi:hypothetical protein
MEIATTADENTELSLFVELAATATATDALAFEVTRAVRAELEVINRQCASAMGLLPMSADRPPAVAYKGAI